MVIPRDRKFSETHEWALISEKKDPKTKKRNLVTVGLTDYAVSRLSDLVYIELPKVGDEFEQGVPFGEIESVKTVADLYAPIGGKIVEVNEDVTHTVDLIAKDPYDEGWLVRLEVQDLSELDSLMSSEDYEKHIKSEDEERGSPAGEEEDEDEGFFM